MEPGPACSRCLTWGAQEGPEPAPGTHGWEVWRWLDRIPSGESPPASLHAWGPWRAAHYMWRQGDSVILIYDYGCGGGGTYPVVHHSSEHIQGLSLSFSTCQMGILTPLTGLWWGRQGG